MSSIRGGAYCSTSPAVSGGAAIQIPLDTLDSGYPYTKPISGSGLVVYSAGPIRVLAQAKATVSLTLTLKVNGTAVSPTGSGTTATITYIYAAHAGDVLTIWEADSGNIFTDTVTGGAANTFVHYEVYGAAATQPPSALNRANLF